MLLVTFVVFGLLIWIARLKESSPLFPPVIFAAVWLFTLTGILLWGDAYYPIPDKAYAVFIVGAASFTLGSILMAQRLGPAAEAGQDASRGSRLPRLALDFCLIVCAINLPFYWRLMNEIAQSSDMSTVLESIRQAEVALSEERSTFGIVRNIAGVSAFTSYAMVYELDGTRGRRWRALAAIGLSLAYGLISGAKTPAVATLAALALIHSARAKRLKLSTLGSYAAVGFISFCSGILLINLASESFGSSLEAVYEVGREFRLYWLSGLVAFGYVALHPNAMESTQPISRFFLETARSLGFPVYVPPKHAEFVNVNINEPTNIYTPYFSYFKDHGWIGTVLIMAMLGALMTFLYRNALRGRPVATLLFGQLGHGVLMGSVTAEYFFYGLNTHIKLLVFGWVLYRVLPALAARRVAAHA